MKTTPSYFHVVIVDPRIPPLREGHLNLNYCI
ncbi:rCG36900 [Rattus norvegicus]|uniref:RCG36900 n=1 Tax=Rattus norvegicus TaxID=10116 RepID=A6HTG6_RAT|nr:rCG36900 [Rattus norvegicus]